MEKIVYVTGNTEKAKNFSRHMKRDIPHHSIDVDEIQTLDMRALVEHKARQAFEQIGQPVLVEDVSLTFDAWGKLPGPFIKFFVQGADTLEQGVEKLSRMLDGFDNRAATASCTFAFFDGKDITYFDGRLRGEIVKVPRGENGFGFDKIFQAEGFEGKTAAELDEAEYDAYYSKIKPFTAIKQFIDEKEKNSESA